MTVFAVVTPSRIDLDAEMLLWILGMGPLDELAANEGCSIARKFHYDSDTAGIQQVLADHVCGTRCRARRQRGATPARSRMSARSTERTYRRVSGYGGIPR